MPDPIAAVEFETGAGFELHPDKAKTVSRAMLALGAGLLVFVPLGGALFLLSGVLGLAIASEGPGPPPPPTSTTAPAVPTTATGLSNSAGTSEGRAAS